MVQPTLFEYFTSTEVTEALYLGASQANDFAEVDGCRLGTKYPGSLLTVILLTHINYIKKFLKVTLSYQLLLIPFYVFGKYFHKQSKLKSTVDSYIVSRPCIKFAFVYTFVLQATLPVCLSSRMYVRFVFAYSLRIYLAKEEFRKE